MFLTNSLVAFFYICNGTSVSVDLWTKCQAHLRLIYTEISHLFSKSKYLDSVFLLFGNDDFLRVFLYRYVFCLVTLKLSRSFRVNFFIRYLNVTFCN